MRTRLLVLCTLVTLSTPSVAAPTPAIYGAGSSLDGGTNVGYGSELDAVIAATDRYNPLSIAEDREFMGMILERDNQYFYTATPGQRGRDRISIRVQKPKVFRITAFWHTHGAPAKERIYFSNVDTRLVNRSDTPFYLCDHTGSLRVFNPGDRVLTAFQAGRKGLPSKQGFGKGNLVRDKHSSFRFRPE